MSPTITPPSASATERRLDAAADQRVGAIDAALPASAWDPARVPAPWLPILAWALSVDLWDPAWDDALKRRVIREAAQLHREKGTVAALRRVLEAIGAVYDYAEPPDAPFTATVTVRNTSALLLGDLADLSPQLERVTRASVHLTLQTEDGFCVPIDIAGGLGVVTLAPALRVA